jgi:hypothetical protein
VHARNIAATTVFRERKTPVTIKIKMQLGLSSSHAHDVPMLMKHYDKGGAPACAAMQNYQTAARINNVDERRGSSGKNISL